MFCASPAPEGALLCRSRIIDIGLGLKETVQSSGTDADGLNLNKLWYAKSTEYNTSSTKYEVKCGDEFYSHTIHERVAIAASSAILLDACCC
eukprot:scaffold1279_cov76-Skeletonema_menzelii.AAC.2